MNAPDIDTRLAEIEARANAATPGPWYASNHGSGATYVHTGELDESGAPLSQIISGEVGLEASNANATLMATAREDVPWLIAQLRKMNEYHQAYRKSMLEEFSNICEREAILQAAEARVRAMHPMLDGFDQDPSCASCVVLWPCDTIRALAPDTTSENVTIAYSRTIEGDVADEARGSTSLPAESRIEPGPNVITPLTRPRRPLCS